MYCDAQFSVSTYKSQRANKIHVLLCDDTSIFLNENNRNWYFFRIGTGRSHRSIGVHSSLGRQHGSIAVEEDREEGKSD